MRKLLCSLVFVLGLFSLLLPHQVQAADTNTYSVNTKINFSDSKCFQYYKDCTIAISINNRLNNKSKLLTEYPVAKLPAMGTAGDNLAFKPDRFDWRDTQPPEGLYATYTIYDKHKKVIASGKANARLGEVTEYADIFFLYFTLSLQTTVLNDKNEAAKCAVSDFTFEALERPKLASRW